MTLRHYILDEERRPVVEPDVETWARFFEHEPNRRVAWSQVNSSVTVSTVFLGLDHRFGTDGPPLLFETMVFGGKDNGHMQRYASWDDALTGHAVLVRRLRAKRKVRT